MPWKCIKIRMRPTILIAEGEPREALSARKLILETAKFNVLTAHSTAEAFELIEAFPRISAVVLAAHHTIEVQRLADTIKESLPQIPVIALSGIEGDILPKADYNLSSFKPEQLLDLARNLLGDPRNVDKGRFNVPG